jgi:predicted small metal-binding protein
MPRELRCSDLMPGCSYVAQGKDDNEVLERAAQHAKKDHGMTSIPPDVEQQARTAIRDAR